MAPPFEGSDLTQNGPATFGGARGLGKHLALPNSTSIVTTVAPPMRAPQALKGSSRQARTRPGLPYTTQPTRPPRNPGLVVRQRICSSRCRITAEQVRTDAQQENEQVPVCEKFRATLLTRGDSHFSTRSENKFIQGVLTDFPA